MNSAPNYKKELREALDIALFKKPAMHTVATDKNKTTFAYYIIIAGALLGIIGQQIFPAFFKPNFGFSILMGVIQVVMAIIGIYAISYIAKSLFKGHADHDQFFRVMAYGMIVMWIGLVPQLGIISGLWGLALLFVILKVVHKLTTGNAVITIIIGFVVLSLISAVLSPLYMRFGGYGVAKSIKYTDYSNPLAGSKLNLQNGGKVEFGGDSMKLTNEDGEAMEWKIPKLND